VEGASEQADRMPYKKPQVRIVRPAPPVEASVEDKLMWLETLTTDDVVLDMYECHPTIKYKMIA
jgi:thymidylate synthase